MGLRWLKVVAQTAQQILDHVLRGGRESLYKSDSLSDLSCLRIKSSKTSVGICIEMIKMTCSFV